MENDLGDFQATQKAPRELPRTRTDSNPEDFFQALKQCLGEKENSWSKSIVPEGSSQGESEGGSNFQTYFDQLI